MLWKYEGGLSGQPGSRAIWKMFFRISLFNEIIYQKIFMNYGKKNATQPKWYILFFMESWLSRNVCRNFHLMGQQMLVHQFFEESGQNLSHGLSHEIWGNFPKFCLKLLKIWKIIVKFSEKIKSFSVNLHFCARCGENYYIGRR